MATTTIIHADSKLTIYSSVSSSAVEQQSKRFAFATRNEIERNIQYSASGFDGCTLARGAFVYHRDLNVHGGGPLNPSAIRSHDAVCTHNTISADDTSA